MSCITVFQIRNCTKVQIFIQQVNNSKDEYGMVKYMTKGFN